MLLFNFWLVFIHALNHIPTLHIHHNKEWWDDMLAFFQLNCYILDAAVSNHTISHRQDITLPCHQLLASPNISWPCKKNGKIVLRINLLTQVCRATNCLHLPIWAGLAKSMVRLCWESIFWHRFSLTIFLIKLVFPYLTQDLWYWNPPTVFCPAVAATLSRSL